ncbi:hypothetical protein AM10699_10340 [Acaryochloris marina MBIC10699]|nr:hypothetical protein AM10699_10340 [Acaryochloris marina MBIC10699]
MELVLGLVMESVLESVLVLESESGWVLALGLGLEPELELELELGPEPGLESEKVIGD